MNPAIVASGFVLIGAAWWMAMRSARASTMETLTTTTTLDPQELGPAVLPEPSFLDSIFMSIEKMTRGERNNNPGNIRKSSATWLGKIEGNDSAFETFDSPENGLRALGRLLLNYQRVHGLNTVRGIINRWAPPSENDTESYVNAVARALNVHPDTSIDLKDPLTMRQLIAAIVTHENGRNIFSPGQIASAADRALA